MGLIMHKFFGDQRAYPFTNDQNPLNVYKRLLTSDRRTIQNTVQHTTYMNLKAEPPQIQALVVTWVEHHADFRYIKASL